MRFVTEGRKGGQIESRVFDDVIFAVIAAVRSKHLDDNAIFGRQKPSPASKMISLNSTDRKAKFTIVAEACVLQYFPSRSLRSTPSKTCQALPQKLAEVCANDFLVVSIKRIIDGD